MPKNTLTGMKRCVASVLLKSEDSLLLLRRYKEPHAGHLCPVGGKLDPFEGTAEAARREVLEETGIVLKELQFCGTLSETSPLPKYNWLSFIYLAEIDACAPPYCNEGQLEWVKTADIETTPLPEGDIWIYRFALQARPFMISSSYDAQLRLLHMQEEFRQQNLLL